MNKAELVSIVAETAKVTKKDAEAVINAALSTIEQELVKGGKVQLLGFGTFEVRPRKAREGRNPRTMETMMIPAGKNPVFKAGKALKTSVDK